LILHLKCFEPVKLINTLISNSKNISRHVDFGKLILYLKYFIIIV